MARFLPGPFWLSPSASVVVVQLSGKQQPERQSERKEPWGLQVEATFLRGSWPVGARVSWDSGHPASSALATSRRKTRSKWSCWRQTRCPEREGGQDEVRAVETGVEALSCYIFLLF